MPTLTPGTKEKYTFPFQATFPAHKTFKFPGPHNEKFQLGSEGRRKGLVLHAQGQKLQTGRPKFRIQNQCFFELILGQGRVMSGSYPRGVKQEQ